MPFLVVFDKNELGPLQIALWYRYFTLVVWGMMVFIKRSGVCLLVRGV